MRRNQETYSEITPGAIKILNEFKSLKLVMDLQSKVISIPSDLPLRQKLLEDINSYLGRPSENTQLQLEVQRLEEVEESNCLELETIRDKLRSSEMELAELRNKLKRRKPRWEPEPGSCETIDSVSQADPELSLKGCLPWLIVLAVIFLEIYFRFVS